MLNRRPRNKEVGSKGERGGNTQMHKSASSSRDNDASEEVSSRRRGPLAPPSDDEEDEIPLEDSEDEDEDESDEDGDDSGPDIPGVDISKLPTIAKDDATVARKLSAAKAKAKNANKEEDERGVIYLGRIPHGFYEDEMRGYFSQFGEVTRLRLSRNKKTGKSKHYAFIEFESLDVAKIVQETMDNYLLLGHILKCSLLEKDEVHPQLWVGADKKWRVVRNDRVERQKFNKIRTQEEQEKAEKRLLQRQDQKKRKLLESGIDYDMSEVEYKKSR